MNTKPITTFPRLLQAMAPACAPRRNEVGRLVRVEFIEVPATLIFTGTAEVEGPCDRGSRHVALIFDDRQGPPVLRTYEPGRRD